MKIIDQFPDVDRLKRIVRPAAEWAMCAIFAVGMTALVFAAIIATQGCSTRTLVVMPDGTINATVTSLLYCPEATVIRVQDGNRTVDVMGEASGVGPVLESLGNNAAEVMRP